VKNKIRTSVLGLAGAAGYAIAKARRPARLLPGLAGAVLLSWGAAMIYAPAGLIAAGLMLLVIDRTIER
jgi:hypothetical protein